jgi:hypothetical protein
LVLLWNTVLNDGRARYDTSEGIEASYTFVIEEEQEVEE